MVFRQRETLWGRKGREDSELNWEGERLEGEKEKTGLRWLQISRDGDWTEVWFSYEQPLQGQSDRDVAQIPALLLLLSISSLSSVELLSRLACPPIWSSGQDMGSGAGCLTLFFFYIISCLPAGRPSFRAAAHRIQWWPTGCWAGLSVHYALVDKKGVIVPAVCSNNERVNMSQVFPQDWGREGGSGSETLLLPSSINQCLSRLLRLHHFLLVLL